MSAAAYRTFSHLQQTEVNRLRSCLLAGFRQWAPLACNERIGVVVEEVIDLFVSRATDLLKDAVASPVPEEAKVDFDGCENIEDSRYFARWYLEEREKNARDRV